MFKRILTVFMCVLLVVSVLPTAVWADGIPTIQISGTPALGQTLIASLESDTTPIFQWYRSNTKIDGARSAQYTIKPEDLGSELSVMTEGTVSNPKSISIPKATPDPNGTPIITGISYGQTVLPGNISAVRMTVGETHEVYGRFEAVDPSKKPYNGESVQVRFVPDDDTRFNPVTMSARAEVDHITFRCVTGDRNQHDVLIYKDYSGNGLNEDPTETFTITRNGATVQFEDLGSYIGFNLSKNDSVGQEYVITMNAETSRWSDTERQTFIVDELPDPDPSEILDSAVETIERNLRNESVDSDDIKSESDGIKCAKELVESLILDDITVTITPINYLPPIAGTEDYTSGTNGKFTYSVQLECQGETRNVSSSYTITITPDTYKEPENNNNTSTNNPTFPNYNTWWPTAPWPDNSWGVTVNTGTTTETAPTPDTAVTDSEPMTSGVQIGVQVGVSEYSYSGNESAYDSSFDSDSHEAEPDESDNGFSYVGNTVRFATNNRTLMPYYYDEYGNLINVPLCSYIGGELVFVGRKGIDYQFRQSEKRYYNDISGHWASEYITEVSRMQLFVGTADNTFSPNIQMTYGMFVTVLGRMSGEYITDSNGYGDFVRWAERTGITSGVPVLGNNEPIDRETAAMLLANFAEYMGASVTGGTTSRFIDSGDISAHARTAVAALTNAGIIAGRDTGTFDPKAYLTRAETTVLITRIVPYIVKGIG